MRSIWFLICLFFYFFNLQILIDLYPTSYLKVEQDDSLFDNVSYFLLCTPFYDLKFKDNYLLIDR